MGAHLKPPTRAAAATAADVTPAPAPGKQTGPGAADAATSGTPAGGNSSLDADAGTRELRAAVELAERDADVLAGATDAATIRGRALELAAALRRAALALYRRPGDTAAALDLLRRLERPLGMMAALARQHQLSLQGTSLDKVWDAEDALRVRYAMTRAARADNYYDDDVATGEPRADAPAQIILRDLQDGDSAPPSNRQQMIDRILGFPLQIATAFQAGREQAEHSITEPNRPTSESLVTQLLRIAGDALEIEAEAFVVRRLAEVAFSVKKSVMPGAPDGNVEAKREAQEVAVLTAQLTKLSKNGKGAAQAVARTESRGSRGGGDEDTSKSVKTRFLDEIASQTVELVADMSARFASQSGLLHRVPVATLTTVYAALDRQLLHDLRRDYANAVIDQWLILGKQAADGGVDVSDPDRKRPGNPSKLDALAPSFVVDVDVTLDDNRAPQLDQARLRGVGDSVVADVRNRNVPIDRLPVYRRIRVGSHVPDGVPLGFLEIDPHGALDASHANTATPEARAAWAQIGRHAEPVPRALAIAAGDGPFADPAGTVSDNDVEAGMYALVRWLATIDSSLITSEQGQ